MRNTASEKLLFSYDYTALHKMKPKPPQSVLMQHYIAAFHTRETGNQ